MLSDRAVGAWSGGRLCPFGVHDAMDAGLLRDTLAPSVWAGGLWGIDGCASAVPDAAHVVTRYDLGQATGLDVTDFDEAGVEEKDVWWVPCNVFCSALPLDALYSPAWVSVAVHIQSKFCVRGVREVLGTLEHA